MTGRLRAAAGPVRIRITALAAMSVLAVLCLTFLGLVQVHRWLLIEALDESLVDQAAAVAAQLATVPPAGLPLPGSDDLGVQVVGPDGSVLAASGTLRGQPPLTTPSSAGVRELVLSGDAAARVLSRRAGDGFVNVAGSLDDVRDSAGVLVGSLLVTVPLTTAVLAGLVWWLVGRTLRPVEQIRGQVEGISLRGLDRRVAEPGTGDEVARLARTMNGMLARLQEAAERQRQFVADASHELRSPLARIRSQLEVDLAHPQGADLAATHRDVLADTLTLQRLVDDLLVLGRLDAPAPVGAITSGEGTLCDLDHVVSQAASRIRRTTRVRVDTSGVAPVQVVGRPHELERVVTNLLDNAARHAHSTVMVRLTDEAGMVRLTVADDGPGIPADEHENVFRRFTRLDAARTAHDGGAGLGLAIAREIAQRHGGSLAIDPAHDPGIAFVLSLPAASA